MDKPGTVKEIDLRFRPTISICRSRRPSGNTLREDTSIGVVLKENEKVILRLVVQSLVHTIDYTFLEDYQINSGGMVVMKTQLDVSNDDEYKQ